MGIFIKIFAYFALWIDTQRYGSKKDFGVIGGGLGYIDGGGAVGFEFYNRLLRYGGGGRRLYLCRQKI